VTGKDAVDAINATDAARSAVDPGGLVRAYEAASMYYVQGETMEVIAHHLGVSRSTVSRLLARARQEGIVRVSLVQPGGAGSLEGRMAQVFGVRTHIVPVREGTTEIHRLQQVASVAAARMVDLIETLAENLSDSVVAPLLWFALLGLPGAALYRFANTADAMWGYPGVHGGRYWQWAGKWAAHADDVLNWLPARLTAGLLMLGAGRTLWQALPAQAHLVKK